MLQFLRKTKRYANINSIILNKFRGLKLTSVCIAVSFDYIKTGIVDIYYNRHQIYTGQKEFKNLIWLSRLKNKDRK